MIQSVLFFALGFLCATFIALAIAPALRRRAATLTRRRLEASLPLSLNEMQAETDRARAEGAMAVRRLEIDLKSMREKVATQSVELSRMRDEMRTLSTDAGSSNELSDLEESLRRRDVLIDDLSQRLEAAEAVGKGRADEFDQLDKALEEASFASSSGKIELASRDSEIERLTTDLSRSRSAGREAEHLLAELRAEKEALEESLTVERMRTSDLKKRLENGEIRRPDPAPEETMTSTASAEPSSGDPSQELRLASLSAERDRLESRLTTLTRENKRLRAAKLARTDHGEPGEDRLEDDSALRDEIQKLAADVVNLTARLEGPDSPIARALARPSFSGLSLPREEGPQPSLADRVRALQKKSSKS